MESHTTALDRLLDSDHLRFLIAILTNLFPIAYTYGYRAGSIFIKISAAIEQEISASFLPEKRDGFLQVVCTRKADGM